MPPHRYYRPALAGLSPRLAPSGDLAGGPRRRGRHPRRPDAARRARRRPGGDGVVRPADAHGRGLRLDPVDARRDGPAGRPALLTPPAPRHVHNSVPCMFAELKKTVLKAGVFR